MVAVASHVGFKTRVVSFFQDKLLAVVAAVLKPHPAGAKIQGKNDDDNAMTWDMTVKENLIPPSNVITDFVNRAPVCKHFTDAAFKNVSFMFLLFIIDPGVDARLLTLHIPPSENGCSPCRTP